MYNNKMAVARLKIRTFDAHYKRSIDHIKWLDTKRRQI